MYIHYIYGCVCVYYSIYLPINVYTLYTRVGIYYNMCYVQLLIGVIIIAYTVTI